MPGVVVVVVDHAAGLVRIGREYVHRGLEVVVHHARLKFQRGQARDAAGREPGDNARLHACIAARIVHRRAEIVRDVDHAHVGLGAVGFGFGINCHCDFSPFTGTPDSARTMFCPVQRRAA